MDKISKLTKIVATLGPATDSEETIEKLIKSGVNVFRFNTKHAEPKWHEARIKRVQKVADKLAESIGIMLDLQGPELRIETKDEKDINIKKGDEVKVSTSFEKGVELAIPSKPFFKALKKGDKVYVDNGRIVLNTVSVKKDSAMLSVRKDSVIKNHKGVNLPGKRIDLPSLVKKDLEQLNMASLNKVDFIALSFVGSAEDVKALRTEMDKRKTNAKVVVKIENKEALNNIDSLIEQSDAVMVARGDLGIEVPIEEIAYWQKVIIEKCKKAHKPVITATEMLESMINQSRPTRAEATDVSNAVFAGTDALMLSAETAIGDYPVESVETMANIAKFSESVKDFRVDRKKAEDQTQLIGMAAMDMIVNEGIDVDKIIVFTQTGYTARVVSSFRPKVPIIAVTDKQSTVEFLTLSCGVTGYKFRFPNGKMVSPDYVVDKLYKKDIVNKEETILVIHGARWKKPGLTNSITLVASSEV